MLYLLHVPRIEQELLLSILSTPRRILDTRVDVEQEPDQQFLLKHARASRSHYASKGYISINKFDVQQVLDHIHNEYDVILYAESYQVISTIMCIDQPYWTNCVDATEIPLTVEQAGILFDRLMPTILDIENRLNSDGQVSDLDMFKLNSISRLGFSLNTENEYVNVLLSTLNM